MDIDKIIEQSRQEGASDIHLKDGMPILLRKHGNLTALVGSSCLSHKEILDGIQGMLAKERVSGDPMKGDVDFCYGALDGSRQRINVYRQDGRVSVAIRLLSDHIPSLEELGLPSVLHQLAENPRGLVLITGATGSGKSTTLAAMIDEINQRRSCHILTIEDPVEYQYQTKNSLINQREIGRDVGSFGEALLSALRQDPDVIHVGEMRDFETIGAAITAAETGHLVFSTLHTIGAANTVDRMIDVFPGEQQARIRTQLAAVLKGVVTQQLLPKADGKGRIPVTEVMIATDAVCNLIRENKTHQINMSIQTGAALGMHTLNASIAELALKGVITRETAFSASNDRNDLARLIK